MDERQNIQRSTSNFQRPTGKPSRGGERPRVNQRNYDLEERLLDYSCRIIRLVNKLPRTRAGNHVARQVLKSGTSPLPNHGEAQAAQSVNDFVHKMTICLKEFRESYRWLRLVERTPLVRKADDFEEVGALILETQELIKIFFTSIRTASRGAGSEEVLPRG